MISLACTVLVSELHKTTLYKTQRPHSQLKELCTIIDRGGVLREIRAIRQDAIDPLSKVCFLRIREAYLEIVTIAELIGDELDYVSLNFPALE